MLKHVITAAICILSLTTLGCGDGQLEADQPRELSPDELATLSDGHFATMTEDRTDEIITASLTSPHQFWLGGQQAWFHDSGFGYGFFHTYDGLKACGDSDAPRKVHVFLPRDYEARQRRYPVVYMQDGDTTFWPGGAANKSWRVGQTLTTLQAQGAIEPVIIVAITPLDREYEYTHTSWAPGRASGGAQVYADYVADCVKPFIDANYYTDAKTGRTAIVGSSHGGLLAFYAATRRPDRFGLAGALSPSLWAGIDSLATGWLANEQQRDLEGLRRSSLVQPVRALLSSARHPKLWIDWGLAREGGFHNSIIEKLATKRSKDMVALLQQEHGYEVNKDLFWHEDRIGGHDEDAWAYRFGLMMRAFYPANAPD